MNIKLQIEELDTENPILRYKFECFPHVNLSTSPHLKTVVYNLGNQIKTNQSASWMRSGYFSSSSVHICSPCE